MADIKSLKSKRGVIKGTVTRFEKFLASFNISTSDIFELEDRRTHFQPLLHQFNEIQEQIELLDNAEAPDVSVEERDKFETTYFTLNSKAEKIIAENNHRNSQIHSEVTNASPLNSVSTSQVPQQIRLPEINLPKFTGNYEEWYDFYNTFNSIINSNTALSKIQKLQYLKSLLRGEAAEVLSSIEISESNYDCAWDLLKERYDNKRIIINKHIQSIFNLPTITKENCNALRQLVDGIIKHVRILKSLKRPVNTWDDILIHIVLGKLDTATIKDWESSLDKDQLPLLDDLTNFLSKKCGVLEAVSRKIPSINQSNKQAPSFHQKYHKPTTTTAHVSTYRISCSYCNSREHIIYNCNEFLNLPVSQRITEITSRALCKNCLRRGHKPDTCYSGSCRKCNNKHNTLLHSDNVSVAQPATTATCHSSAAIKQTQILLSTVIVDVRDSFGQYHKCRALLDSGSQSCFITNAFTKKLNIPLTPVHIPVIGINNVQSQISSKINITFRSCYNSFHKNIECLILGGITSKLPTNSIDLNEIQIPKNITLADPDFNKPRDIDMLLGATLFWELLCVGQIRQGRNRPIFQKTQLGWIISGQVPCNSSLAAATTCNFATSMQLNANLTKFWDIEEYNQNVAYSKEEKLCEDHFLNNVRRNDDGRFIVKIPFKDNGVSTLGDSKQQAEKRFMLLERKLQKNPPLKEEYTNFMNEYEALGHMQLADSKIDDNPNYYLPHHSVIKQNSLTTKLRVVFDGSARSSSGVSLNDIQMVGPVLQQDLFSIVSRFRTHKYVMTADIAKMYRQVLVDESQVRFQRILWRDNPNDEIKTYELSTVTYGTASASFLAIRALRQLAIEEQQNFPLASEITLRDFYVDDLLTGANTTQEISKIQAELCEMLSKGGFHLRKWISNCPEISKSLSETDFNTVSLDKDQSISALGLQWKAHKDILTYAQPIYQKSSKITKRRILSNIAQLFDPLGLLGPYIVIAKLLMQQMWQIQITWDESVPSSIHTCWTNFEDQLTHLGALKIPRCVIVSEDVKRVELHGFSDASEQAYGACIYIRASNSKNNHSTNLLCSKSRVAPLKHTSLPKLELCGAVLLARLMEKVTNSLSLNINQIIFWSDSTIVLSWIKSPSRNFKTFVANRIGEIQDLTNPTDWHHVSSKQNPADLISRGSNLNNLINSELWWHGPSWLLEDYTDQVDNFDSSKLESNLLEKRTIISNIIIHNKSFDIFVYSSVTKLIRITAYCLRFIHNARHKSSEKQSSNKPEPLSTSELKRARECIIRIVQKNSFPEDLTNLRKNGCVNKNSKLLSLNPFLDKDEIIRVGGRLQNAPIPIQQKHPIILPKTHIFTKSLIRCEHERLFHAGPQVLLSVLREQYWIVGGRDLIRQIIRQCITCFKVKPSSLQPIMGNLPQSRVSPSRPFTQCGIDYFGPLNIRENRKRNYKVMKAYGAIFICFSTKAVHLELVSDLSTDTFLGALKRFIARRGKPLNIYSDNGTNFVGANRQLQELSSLFNNESSKNKIISTMADNDINWHFIPPRAPHFGGIWEAAVKSTKYHIRRVVGNACLTYEEMYTFLVQTEAILNSRPLIPLSHDPNEFSTLTPGHFLIGDTLTSNAEPDLSQVATNRLQRWQHVERLRQHFWSRWTKEYLSQLQIRRRWKSRDNHLLKLGQLVLIREDNSPPLQWCLGRIEAIHPGSDGIIRAATVRTPSGTFKRPAVRLCPLPLE